MSYSLFRKRFLERAGTSPGDYRIRRRIERAMALLTKEKLLVKEVAAQLGYPDEYAFSAQFKKVAGVSPTIFRERHG
jgi:AraC-like DNA-binding protein